MTVLDTLKNLKAFIDETIKNQNLKFQKEDTEDELVFPYVEICYFPHKNFTPFGFSSPAVLISFDGDSDGANENALDIRLICSTYGGGYYQNTTIPDSKGYIDLINLMELLKIAIVNQWTFGGGTLEKPINIGMYDTELAWPYWYGYISFTVQIPATEYVINKEMEDFLHGDI